MTRKFILALGVALITLAACQPPQQQPTTPAASNEPIDPFVVAIDAERWSVLIDKALEGVRQSPEPSVGIAENDQGRADRAVRDGAAALLQLRNALCGKAILMGDKCRIKDWPAWASEPPNPETPLEVIKQRSEWLGEAMQPFTDAGCEAGKRAFQNEQYCSVE